MASRTKYCNGCLETKKIAEFNKRADRANGRQSKCKECYKELHRKWRARTVDKRKDNWLRHRYRISLEKRDELIREQDGRCAICKDLFDEQIVPYVDHNHISCVVRGILCSKCNSSIGMMRDNIVILQNAITYLKERDV